MRVVVIGGGIAGAAAACHLARQGIAPLLLERAAGPQDKVCGEFISVEAQAYLAELGVDLAALGAVPIEGLRLHAAGREAAARLPFSGLSLSRRVLDEAVLRRAAALGAVIRRGAAATRLDKGGGAVELADGSRLTADAVILATGKHALRGARPRPMTAASPIGFKLHLRLAPAAASALRRRVELHLFDGGYAGIEPVEDGRANLCLVVAPDRYAALGRSWPRLLAAIAEASPGFFRLLAGAQPCRGRPLAVAALRYGYLHEEADEPGVYRIGDQLAVIPSFAGDGIAIALHSARRAAAAIARGEAAGAWHAALRRELRPQMRRAMLLSRLNESAARRRLLLAACRAFPGLLAAAAGRTRLDDDAWRLIAPHAEADPV